MEQALRSSLRLRPDVIVLGEVRGAPANDLVNAWNTGHEGGVCTYHANSARSALSRLANMVSMAPNHPQRINEAIYDAVHVIIHIGFEHIEDQENKRDVLTVQDIGKDPQNRGNRVVKDILQLAAYDKVIQTFTLANMHGETIEV
jgi:Flp pilus assembly CpaF family ATPase